MYLYYRIFRKKIKRKKLTNNSKHLGTTVPKLLFCLSVFSHIWRPHYMYSSESHFSLMYNRHFPVFPKPLSFIQFQRCNSEIVDNF